MIDEEFTFESTIELLRYISIFVWYAREKLESGKMTQEEFLCINRVYKELAIFK